ncbi:MAG: hypothetical protein IK123_10200 [Lachnospiraceae bacterium]|nr:hypothetical protein [Lachnospiraceae bacterium]
MDERTIGYLEQYAGSPYIPRVSFELIPINELTCDQIYQRALSEKQVRRTSDNFDPYQINPVKISKRDGKNYVIDGQHTMEIVAKVSGSREMPVWCMVYDDRLRYEKEANVFAEQAKYARALSPYEIFIAKVESGDEESLMIKAVVETNNFVIGKEVKSGVVCAVKTLEYIYNRLGLDVLSRTLRVCAASWDGDARSLSSNMLKGLSKLLAAFDEKIDDAVLIDKLSVVSLKELTRTAKDQCAGPEGFAEAMLLYYNKKNRQSLSVQRLKLYKPHKSRYDENKNIVEEGLERLMKQREEASAIDEAMDSHNYYGVLGLEEDTEEDNPTIELTGDITDNG